MRGEKYEIVYEGDGDDPHGNTDITVLAIWVPDAGILFQRETRGSITSVYRRKSFPSKGVRILSQSSVNVRQSVITAVQKDLQEQEDIDKSQDALDMEQARLWHQDQRRWERLNRKTDKLFAS